MKSKKCTKNQFREVKKTVFQGAFRNGRYVEKRRKISSFKN